LSTPANEVSTSRPPPGGIRAAPSRPHVVTTRSEKSEKAEAVVAETGGQEVSPEPGHRGLHAVEQHAWASASPRHVVDATPSLGAFAKRVLDILGAIVLGLVFSPLMIVITLLMRRRGGEVIYRHRRVGRDGRMFECLKFRTMVPNADLVLRQLLESSPELRAEWVRDHKLRNDPRITRIGRFLRRTSLDELPQLWNVLRGEMSLVGPRPVVREELLRYGRNVRTYLAAKPGITGLWQVTGRNDTDYRRRVVLDTYYVRNQTLLLDLYILLKTTGVVLGGSGAY
jgi:exopolysaccharide production protein ExoY